MAFLQLFITDPVAKMHVETGNLSISMKYCLFWLSFGDHLKGFENLILMLREKWTSNKGEAKLLGQLSAFLYWIIFFKLHGRANWNNNYACWKILISMNTTCYHYASQQIFDLFLEFTDFGYRVSKKLWSCLISTSMIDKILF